MSQFIKFYFTSMFNMFRLLIHPLSGVCDFSVVSPHGLRVLISTCVGVSVWLVGVVSLWQAEAVLIRRSENPPSFHTSVSNESQGRVSWYTCFESRSSHV